MHSVVRRGRPSLASVLVLLFAATVIIVATFLTLELMIVEAGLNIAPASVSERPQVTLGQRQ